MALFIEQFFDRLDFPRAAMGLRRDDECFEFVSFSLDTEGGRGSFRPAVPLSGDA
jgi:hypothetical protein